ncbi:hypothetical protein GE09DRAFT_1132964 [Coniochaeta sp. 2T2.1]|nr:hypothetical protein GE09DRAFT_1132964 [Coniochaeta sp. 2T2.1]
MSPEEKRDYSDDEQEESDAEVANSESESEEEEEEDLGDTFDRFIRRIKENDLTLDVQANLDTFIKEHESILGKRTSKNQNLLHLLAESAGSKDWYKKTKRLVKALITTQWPEGDLLAQQDADDKTPLYCAIATKDHKLAKVMCEAHPNIDSIIGIPSKQTNSLQKALQLKISTNAELITLMIEKSSPETLCAKDEKGLSPLHLAVAYQRADDTQLNIVKSIVDRCPQAMDQTYDHKESGLLSAYRYQELTHKEGLEQAAREARKKAQEKKESASAANGQASAKSVKDAAPARPRQQAPLEQGPYQPGAKMPTKSEAAPTGKFGSASPKTAVADSAPKPGQLSKTKTEAKMDGKKEKESKTADGKTKVKKSSDGTKKKSSKVSKILPSEEAAKVTKKYLKLYCLRTKNHDDAIEFLYGVQQDRQIYFDLFGAGPTLSQIRMQDSLKHLEFEDILQYVAIPQVKVEGKPVVVKGNRPPPKPDAKGRTDLKLIFNWLKDDKQKKVKTILKVIVDDLKEPAHNDEAIEECLDDLGVEIWDWRKMDISSEVIKKVAPDVREVHLYWSGNHTVLRGWSELEGLRQLKKLETVHLHPYQGLETRQRISQYIASFRQRLESAPERADNPIKVRPDSIRGAPGETAIVAANEVNDPYMRHKWIATMEEFSDFLLTAERNADPPYVLPKPVLVAVIDDGVDINEASVQSRVIGGRSFCHRNEDQNLNQPYYVSSGGHGTAMAGLICKLCPNVKLFVLKLDDKLDASGGRTITAKSAAKAVRAAIDKGVDIISMSWTIERTDLNKDDIVELERAIEEAAAKNILMFCAATDQGAYRDRTYPAASGTKKLFKIGAAEASGAAYKWVGDQSAVDFIMPGHQVVLERHDDRNVTKFTPLTGSSVATALASGLAAIVLYCVQLGGVVKADGNQKEEATALQQYSALKDHERMKEALGRIGLDKTSEHKYILVWNRFGLRKNSTLKKSEKETKDRWILLMRELADELMREE